MYIRVKLTHRLSYDTEHHPEDHVAQEGVVEQRVQPAGGRDQRRLKHLHKHTNKHQQYMSWRRWTRIIKMHAYHADKRLTRNASKGDRYDHLMQQGGEQEHHYVRDVLRDTRIHQRIV